MTLRRNEASPDEVAAAYDREFDAWVRSRDRALAERPWIDRALMLSPRRAGGRRVLDLGCGTGAPIAAYLVDRGATMTGVDASRRMIQAFANRLPGSEALHADIRRLALPGRYDLILAWDSLIHLTAEDQRAFLPRLPQFAIDGTVLLMTTGPRAGIAIGRLGGSPLFHDSLDAAEYRTRLREVGFEVLGHWPESPDIGGRTVWMARLKL